MSELKFKTMPDHNFHAAHQKVAMVAPTHNDSTCKCNVCSVWMEIVILHKLFCLLQCLRNVMVMNIFYFLACDFTITTCINWFYE